jgi:hypothetical protein
MCRINSLSTDLNKIGHLPLHDKWKSKETSRSISEFACRSSLRFPTDEEQHTLLHNTSNSITYPVSHDSQWARGLPCRDMSGGWRFCCRPVNWAHTCWNCNYVHIYLFILNDSNMNWQYHLLNNILSVSHGKYCHVLRGVWLWTGYGFVNGFIDHLYTPLGTTSNYRAIAIPHTLKTTTR